MLNEEKTTGIGVVIGAGTMGGGIAAQLANAGWQVRLLDVPGTDAKTRNQAAQTGLERVDTAGQFGGRRSNDRGPMSGGSWLRELTGKLRGQVSEFRARHFRGERPHALDL